MKRTVIWMIAAALVLAIGISIVVVARHAGSGGQNAGSDDVAMSRCPSTTPDACLPAMGRLYDLSAGPLPRIFVPPSFTYVEGQLLNYKDQRRPVETFTFRAPDGTTLDMDFGPIDATHRFPTIDPRPTETTPQGRTYKETRSTYGTLSIGFVDSRFIYVVHRPYLAVLDRPSGTLGDAEAIVDSIDRVR